MLNGITKATLKNRRRGSLLIMTLFISAMIFMLAVSYSTMVTIESKTIQFHDDVNIAFYVADSGINRGFIELINMPKTGFDNLVNNAGATVSFQDVAFYDADLKTGSYNVTIYGGPEDPSTIAGLDLNVPVMLGDTGTNRGTFKWLFRIQSTGTITRGAETLARRILIAKVLMARGAQVGEYQAYGRIYEWYEKNR